MSEIVCKNNAVTLLIRISEASGAASPQTVPVRSTVISQLIHSGLRSFHWRHEETGVDSFSRFGKRYEKPEAERNSGKPEGCEADGRSTGNSNREAPARAGIIGGTGDPERARVCRERRPALTAGRAGIREGAVPKTRSTPSAGSIGAVGGDVARRR
jgi:hypothetical protein